MPSTGRNFPWAPVALLGGLLASGFLAAVEIFEDIRNELVTHTDRQLITLDEDIGSLARVETLEWAV